MKITLDARYLRPKPSGIGTYVEGIVTRMPIQTPSDDFELWTSPKRRPTAEHSNVQILPVHGDPQGPKSVLFPGLLPSLKGCDVFHSPHNILPRQIPCASVVTVHDVMWLTSPTLVEKNPLFRTLGKRLFGAGAKTALDEASVIIAVSNATRDEVLRVRPDLAPRIRVIHNAQGTWCRPAQSASEATEAKRKAAALLQNEAPFFLVVGVNQPYKNHAAALFALARTPEKNAIMVFVQRRSSGRKLLKLARSLDVLHRVVFVKAQDREDLLTLLQAARALVHPSKVEGFGLPVLEAAACGCPVIASDIPSLREVLDGAGFLVTPDKDFIPSLTAALTSVLLSASLRTELRDLGLARARAFSWDKTAAQTLDAYRDAYALGPRR